MKNQYNHLKFKENRRDNLVLFPHVIDEMIPQNDLVRTVDKVIDKLDTSFLLDIYKPGGAPAYHPLDMLKVIIYAYTQKITSVRKIEDALISNIKFMWLSGMQRPNFRTINYFREKRLEGHIKRIFKELSLFLINQGHADLVNYYLDGTKIEANAKKFSAVWKNSILNYQDKLDKKVELFFQEIHEETQKELSNQQPELLDKNVVIANEKLDEFAKKINEINKKKRLKKKKEDSTNTDPKLGIGSENIEELVSTLDQFKGNKKIERIQKKIRKDILPRQRKYEYFFDILGKRGSYSKTDFDSTFMRMKNDFSGNGKNSRPGYNIQIGSNNQYILDFIIGQSPTDATMLIPLLDEQKLKITAVIADAGYGSEENYNYLEKRGIEAFVKYNTYNNDINPNYVPSEYKKEGMKYDAENDEYICKNNKRLKFIKYVTSYSENKYKKRMRLYQCKDCKCCPFKEECIKSEKKPDIKEMKYSEVYEEYKAQIRDKLQSKEGKEKQRKRGADVETVFGNIKENMKFRRFNLRGLTKTSIEFGIVSIAHNLIKLNCIA